MKKVCLVLGGIDDEMILPHDAIKVGVDYGAWRLAQKHQMFDYAIGDFDSVTSHELTEIGQYAKRIIFLPHKKDETDTEAAIYYLSQRGFQEFELHDALGGRIDHTIANIRLMRRLQRQSMNVSLYGRKQKIKILNPGVHTIERKDWPFKYVSFFACSNEVKPLTISGLFYEVQAVELSEDDIYTISNEWIDGKDATISFEKGELLIINDED